MELDITILRKLISILIDYKYLATHKNERKDFGFQEYDYVLEYLERLSNKL